MSMTSFQIVVGMNHGHYDFLLRSSGNEIITAFFFFFFPEFSCIKSDLVLINVFTLINQNRSQILIIYYVDNQS